MKRNWDWIKRDAELAREHGITRERVRQIRESEDQPHSSVLRIKKVEDKIRPMAGTTIPKTAKMFREEIDPDWLVSAKDFSKIIGRLGIVCHKKPGSSVKYPWDHMNWSLPNQDLSEIWKISYQLIASNRLVFDRSKPAWSRAWGRIPDDPTYRSTVADEKKAAKNFKRKAK